MNEKLGVLSWLPEHTLTGDRFATFLEMMGCPLQRDHVEARVDQTMATHGDERFREFPIVTEIACLAEQWDPNGGLWGRQGHFPLMVSVGSNRSYSETGIALRNVNKDKKHFWHESGEKSWPWWKFHESEQGYWTPGAESSGRGWSGSHWNARVLMLKLYNSTAEPDWCFVKTL